MTRYVIGPDVALIVSSITYARCGFDCSATACLENVAWKIAAQRGWPDTLDAEYVALTQLQADAFITLDVELPDAVKDLVMIAPIDALT